MIKKLVAIACLASLALPLKAEAQSQRQVQVTSIQKQENGLLELHFYETWVEGINLNMMFSTIKDFSCKSKIGRMANVQGTIGINTFNQNSDKIVTFLEGDSYGNAIAPYCR